MVKFFDFFNASARNFFAGTTKFGLKWAKLQDVGILRPDCVVFFDLSPDKASVRGGFGEEVLEALDLQHRVYDIMMMLGAQNKDIWKVFFEVTTYFEALLYIHIHFLSVSVVCATLFKITED